MLIVPWMEALAPGERRSSLGATLAPTTVSSATVRTAYAGTGEEVFAEQAAQVAGDGLLFATDLAVPLTVTPGRTLHTIFTCYTSTGDCVLVAVAILIRQP